MVKNLRKMLLEISEKPMKEQKILLDDIFDEWKGERKQTDDVLIVGIQV